MHIRMKLVAVMMALSMLAGFLAITPDVAAATITKPSWQTEASLPVNVTQHVVVTDSDIAYIMGGWNDTNVIVNSTYSYNMRTGEVKKLANMSVGARGAGATVYDGKIYVFGGARAADPFETYMNETQIYDIARDNWTRGANMPVGVVECRAVTVSDVIYVLGGGNWSVHGTLSTWGGETNLTQIYHVQSNGWTLGPVMTEKVLDGSAIFNNGFIYYFGGESNVSNSKVIRLSLSTNTWGDMRSLPKDLAHQDAVLANDGLIYLVGGATDDGFGEGYNSTYYYDMVTDRYYNCSVLPKTINFARIGLCSDGRLFEFGGNNATIHFNSVYSLQIWTTAISATPATVGTGRSFSVSAEATFAFQDLDYFHGTARLFGPDQTQWASVSFSTVSTSKVTFDVTVPQVAPAGQYVLAIEEIHIHVPGGMSYIPVTNLSVNVVSLPSMQTQIDGLNNDLADLQAQLSAVDINITGLETNETALRTLIASTDGQIVELQARLVSTQTSIDELSQTMGHRFDDMGAAQNATRLQMETLRAQVAALSAELNTSRANLATAQASLGSIQSSADKKADSTTMMIVLVLAIVLVVLAALSMVMLLRRKKGGM